MLSEFFAFNSKYINTKLSKEKFKKTAERMEVAKVKPKKKWINSSRAVRKGIKYKVELIGAIDVKHYTGQHIVSQAIIKATFQYHNNDEKLKKQFLKLKITDRFIELRNVDTKNVVYSYKLESVSFTYENKREKDLFCFVATDMYDRHICFVLKHKKAMNLVQTLGQAFKLNSELYKESSSLNVVELFTPSINKTKESLIKNKSTSSELAIKSEENNSSNSDEFLKNQIDNLKNYIVSIERYVDQETILKFRKMYNMSGIMNKIEEIESQTAPAIPDCIVFDEPDVLQMFDPLAPETIKLVF